MSDEIVSLFTLMDTHLSKTNLNQMSSESGECNPSHGSHVLLPAPPGPRLAIPKFFTGNSPIKDFLAEKISNTLKAKERQKGEEEQRKIEEEMKKLDIKENMEAQRLEDGERNKITDQPEYLIDLTSAIIKQTKPNRALQNNDEISQRGLFNLEEGNDKPSNRYSWSSITTAELFRTTVSETTLPTGDSYLAQSAHADLEEDDMSIMSRQNEVASMTEEDEMKQKEKLWIEEELRKMKIRHEQEYPPLKLLNDIMPQNKPIRARPQPPVKSRLSKGLVFDKETCLYKEWDPTLPCTTDISHILKNTMKRGKCSTFGKVLCSRVPSVYKTSIPYTRQKFNSNIMRFDFKTKSPADIYNENQTSRNKKQTKSQLPARFMLDLMECI